MGPLTTDYYSVQYQVSPALVRGVVLRPLSETEFTESCELLLMQAQRYGCPFWLLDSTAGRMLVSAR